MTGTPAPAIVPPSETSSPATPPTTPAEQPTTPAVPADAPAPTPEAGKTVLTEDPAAKPAEAPAFTAESLRDAKMPNGNPIPEVLQAGLLEALNAPAEKRLEAMISLHSKALETIDEESLAAWDRQKEEWGEALKADPEYGGAKLAESKAALARLYALYPKSAELRKALDDTGMGNHPEIARLLFWAAGRLTEAKPVSSNETPTVDGQTAALNALYPSMATKG